MLFEELVHGLKAFAIKLDYLLADGTNYYEIDPSGLQIRRCRWVNVEASGIKSGSCRATKWNVPRKRDFNQSGLKQMTVVQRMINDMRFNVGHIHAFSYDKAV